MTERTIVKILRTKIEQLREHIDTMISDRDAERKIYNDALDSWVRRAKKAEAEVERLRGLSPDNMPKNENEWWIALKDQNRKVERLRMEIRALHQDDGAVIAKLQAVNKQLTAENERLNGAVATLHELRALDAVEIAEWREKGLGNDGS